MHRYVDVSDFRTPYDSPQIDVAGLGANQYPTARRYFDVSNFRAPYEHGYFQDNTLFGVGSAPILEQAQEVLCPVKDPIRNPYTVSALLLGVILGGGAGWLAARIFR